MKRGVPPTAEKARTGEFTPPGITARARSNRAADTGAASGLAVWGDAHTDQCPSSGRHSDRPGAETMPSTTVAPGVSSWSRYAPVRALTSVVVPATDQQQDGDDRPRATQSATHGPE